MPEAAYKEGALNGESVVFGGNTMDGVTPFGYGCDGCDPPTTLAAYKTQMALHWGASAATVMQQYPPSRFQNNPAFAFVRADADANIVCPNLAQARWAAAKGCRVYPSTCFEARTYLFGYSQKSIRECDIIYSRDVAECKTVDPKTQACVAPGPHAGMHNGAALAKGWKGGGWASHCTEFPFIFGTQKGNSAWNSSLQQECPFVGGAENDLVRLMQGWWGALIKNTATKTHKPELPAPYWEPVAAKADAGSTACLAIELGNTTLQTAVRESDCRFWAQFS